jgi:hypothetical protein
MQVTKHSEARSRERLGIPKKAVAKMATEALERGKRHSDFSGSIKRYLDGVFLTCRSANNMRVHAQHLFLFNGETLITVWQIPPKYRNSKAVIG